MPVYEGAVRIWLPCPDMQSVEGREAEAIGSVKELEELSHKLGCMRMSGVPGIGQHKKICADELQSSVRSRLVDHDLRMRRIYYAAGDQGTIDVMKTHSAQIGSGHATELQSVSLMFRYGDVLKACCRITDRLDECVGAGAVRLHMRMAILREHAHRQNANPDYSHEQALQRPEELLAFHEKNLLNCSAEPGNSEWPVSFAEAES